MVGDLDRRGFLRAVGIGTVWSGFSGRLQAAIFGEKAKQSNIVFIMDDDMGYECLGCYGSEFYRTPVIDRLAAEGVRFEHCYSTPLCTPSRVQLMTGQYNFRNYEGFEYLNPKEKTSGNVLREAGYATCIAGKWQLGGDGSLYHKVDELKDDHPGFPKEALMYHTITDTWTSAGSIPINHVTTTAVRWGTDPVNDPIIIPSGEIRPRVRYPKIWQVRLLNDGESFGMIDFPRLEYICLL